VQFSYTVKIKCIIYPICVNLALKCTIFRRDFNGIAKSLDKIARDANQLVKSGSSPTSKQMQLRVGTWWSLKDCLDGLKLISEMHRDEYDSYSLSVHLFHRINVTWLHTWLSFYRFALKSAIVSSLTWNCRQVAKLQNFKFWLSICKRKLWLSDLSIILFQLNLLLQFSWNCRP
jgi:Casein Kinase 2 substrate